MFESNSRIGIIGLGCVGSHVYEQIRTKSELGLDIAFVCDSNTERLNQVPPEHVRNVNSHAAVALGGIGFDRTHSELIAYPDLDVSVIEIEAVGQGMAIKIQRSIR